MRTAISSAKFIAGHHVEPTQLACCHVDWRDNGHAVLVGDNGPLCSRQECLAPTKFSVTSQLLDQHVVLGPTVGDRQALLFCAWLACSRFQVVIPTWHRTPPAVLACLDETLSTIGARPPYVLTDNVG